MDIVFLMVKKLSVKMDHRIILHFQVSRVTAHGNGIFGYGISFYVHGTFSLSSGGYGKNVVTFSAYMNSPAHVDNKKRYHNSQQISNARAR